MAGKIRSMVITSDDEFIFVSDDRGFLMQYYLRDKNGILEERWNFGRVSLAEIYAIALTEDDKYLFVADGIGNLQQRCVSDFSKIKEYKRVDNYLTYIVT